MMGPGSRSESLAARSRRHGGVLLAAAVLALWVAACGGSSSHSVSGVKGGSEVKAQAINTSGSNPFTASVGKDHAGVTPPTGAASTTGGPATYVASTPGLYGGTRNISVCDARQLVSFLEQNQSKAAAWAGVLGIQTSQIASYVDQLTPVLLRTDTRVTNHGYFDGQATTLQSVLEAGTAVMVNQYGQPTVKCYCGNPLTPPVLLSCPVYTGTAGPGSAPRTSRSSRPPRRSSSSTSCTTPTPASSTRRRRGSTASRARTRAERAPPRRPRRRTSPTTTATGTSSTSTAPPQENPSVSLSPNPVTAGDTVTLSATGFAPNVDLAIDVNRPDGGADHFSTPTDSSGNATYTFPNAGGSITGNYTVTVTNPNSGAHASATIDVVPASSTTTGPSTDTTTT